MKSVCVMCLTKKATFSHINNPDIKCCDDCKTSKMAKIKICIKCENNYASYNYKIHQNPLYCRKCKKQGMINLVTIQCIKCKKNKSEYNYTRKTKPLYCKKCKLSNMIYIEKPCGDCKRFPAMYNKKNSKNAALCIYCKKPNMVKIINSKYNIWNMYNDKITLSNDIDFAGSFLKDVNIDLSFLDD